MTGLPRKRCQKMETGNMKYFLSEKERKASHSTCYHEFFKGRWDENAMVYWDSESLNIHDDLMIALGLDRLIQGIVEEYNPYGETEINACQWKRICAEAEKLGGSLFEAVSELSPWAEENFRQNSVFTILGI